MQDSSLTRRTFLAAAGGAAAVAARPAWGLMRSARTVRKGRVITGRKINIASVGCGGQGGHDIGQFAGERVVALCDVDFARAVGTFKRFPDARRFRDFREMLTEMDEQIDAVQISTPDHMHFPGASMAIERGKHV